MNEERTDSTGHRSTPLMWANYPEVAELLLKHGADPSVGDHPGRTAADYFLSQADGAAAEKDSESKRHAVGLRSIAKLIQGYLK